MPGGVPGLSFFFCYWIATAFVKQTPFPAWWLPPTCSPCCSGSVEAICDELKLRVWPCLSSGTHSLSVLFVYEHMLRRRQTGRCEKAGGVKSWYAVGWRGQAPHGRLGWAQCEPTTPTHPLFRTFSVGKHMQSPSSWVNTQTVTSGGILSLAVRCDSFPRREHLCREVWREPSNSIANSRALVGCKLVGKGPSLPSDSPGASSWALSFHGVAAGLHRGLLPHQSTMLPAGWDCLGHF